MVLNHVLCNNIAHLSRDVAHNPRPTVLVSIAAVRAYSIWHRNAAICIEFAGCFAPRGHGRVADIFKLIVADEQVAVVSTHKDCVPVETTEKIVCDLSAL
eukprot:COSAG02_NODE_224_length_28285_cov_39.533066_17_plen_100_part_00